MANKMFYTVEEAASRLGMTDDEVRGLGESGQLQEFRDRDRLMFKKEQVDLLGGDEAGGIDDDIQLAESGELEPISLSSSNTGSAFNTASDTGADTGISIFDPDESDAGSDANADTFVTGAAFGGDASSSGSGLANLALESDDTSLGGDLLADLGGSKAGTSGGSGSGVAMSDTGGAGSLFEGDTAEPEFGQTAAGPGVPMMVGEPYDGAGSGVAGGAALAMTFVLLGALSVMILGMTGAGTTDLISQINSNVIYGIIGGGIVAIVVCAGIGWMALRKG